MFHLENAYEFAMYNWTGCEKFYIGFKRFKVNVWFWFFVTGCISIFPSYIFLFGGVSCCCARELLMCKEAVSMQESCCCARELLRCKREGAAQGSC